MDASANRSIFFICVAGRISPANRIIPTVGKHIIAAETLPSGGIYVRIDESPQLRIIIPALQVIQAGFFVVDITAVAQGVGLAEGIGHAACDGEDIAPGIVGVFHNGCAADGDDGGNVALEVGQVEIPMANPNLIKYILHDDGRRMQ